MGDKKEKKHYKDLVLRIYWQHDLDLVTLTYYSDFSVAHWMKQALIAYVRNDKSFSIPLPPERPITLEHKNKKIHIRICEEEYGDVVEFIENFRYGFMNNGIKQIMRSYLAEHFLNVYMMNSCYTLKPVEQKTENQIFKRRYTINNTTKAFPENTSELKEELKSQ